MAVNNPLEPFGYTIGRNSILKDGEIAGNLTRRANGRRFDWDAVIWAPTQPGQRRLALVQTEGRRSRQLALESLAAGLRLASRAAEDRS